MRMKWSNENVELSRVRDVIKEFFEGKGFQTREWSLKDGCQVVASPKGYNSLLIAVVEVHGGSNEITVDYIPGGERRQTSLFRMFGPVLTLFGGGVFVLHDLKKKERLEKIEDDFWSFIESFFRS